MSSFLASHGLAGEPAGQRGSVAIGLLLGAFGCEVLAGFPPGRTSPVPAVPEVVAVAYRRTHDGRHTRATPARVTGPWTASWTRQEHAEAVSAVRAAIAAGDVYQANVVGHQRAPHAAEPASLARAVTSLAGATYAGGLAGEGWAVGCASPEMLVAVTGDRIRTAPVKGTIAVGPGTREQLQASAKDRAEHIMIVDLARNDLARVAATGSVAVETLYEVSAWAGLWHAASLVAAQLAPGVGVLDILGALAPGGSVTGAPKRAACHLIAGLEPVGRGPAMGALGFVWPGGLDLGLTIRTVAVDESTVHLWAGGGITWGSDPSAEVEEAAAKAAPVRSALGGASGAAV